MSNVISQNVLKKCIAIYFLTVSLINLVFRYMSTVCNVPPIGDVQHLVRYGRFCKYCKFCKV